MSTSVIPRSHQWETTVALLSQNRDIKAIHLDTLPLPRAQRGSDACYTNHTLSLTPTCFPNLFLSLLLFLITLMTCALRTQMDTHKTTDIARTNISVKFVLSHRSTLRAGWQRCAFWGLVCFSDMQTASYEGYFGVSSHGPILQCHLVSPYQIMWAKCVCMWQLVLCIF